MGEDKYSRTRTISNKTLGPSSINSSGITTRYLELPLSRTFYPVPWEFEIAGVNCSFKKYKNIWNNYANYESIVSKTIELVVFTCIVI